MIKQFLNIAAPVLAAFALAGCATQKPMSRDEENGIVGVMLSVAVQDDFRMVAACRGENGRAAVLSYSESRDQYMLQLLKGRKVEGSLIKPDPANPEAEMTKLDRHCNPHPAAN